MRYLGIKTKNKMSTRDPFAPGGREYEKRKMRKKRNRRKGPDFSSARAVQARNRASHKQQNDSSSEDVKEEASPVMSRREREAQEAQQQQEAYLRALRDGKNAEGRANLERLKEVRARREMITKRKEQQRKAEEERKLAEKKKAINGGRQRLDW